MKIISVYKQNIDLECFLSKLHLFGITTQDMLVVPLGTDQEAAKKTLQGTRSLMDLPFVFGAIGMLLGCIYGFVLYWGPVLWGLIGLIGGIALGLGFEWLLRRKSKTRNKKRRANYVVVMFQCSEQQYEQISTFMQNSEGYTVLEAVSKN